MSERQIVVRRPRLDFAGEVPRFYLEGNALKTHFFNALNLAFPDGERFFVKAVADHRDAIDDPALQRAIRAFSGQEGQHANQHERFFQVLERQGYEVERALRRFKSLARWANRYLPRALRLSMTAGAEHYTATMAALVFEHGMVDDCHPVMRDLIQWHAIEEIEHKDVAYEVLMRTHSHNYPLRMFGFGVVSLFIGIWTVLGTRSLLMQDGRAGRLSRDDYRRARAQLGKGKAAAFRRDLRRHALRYLRPGFHPAQQDDRPLLARHGPIVAARVGA